MEKFEVISNAREFFTNHPVGETFSEPTMTEPDSSRTVRQMYQDYITKGLIPQSEPVYYDDLDVDDNLSILEQNEEPDISEVYNEVQHLNDSIGNPQNSNEVLSKDNQIETNNANEVENSENKSN